MDVADNNDNYKKYKKHILIQKIIKILRKLIAPSSCILCSEKNIEYDGFCIDCYKKIQIISEPQCVVCGIPFSIEGCNICGQCLREKPNFDWGRSLIKYNSDTKPLFMNIKHQERLDIIHNMVPLIKRIMDLLPVKIDYIIPVPLHITRRIFRGYNQSSTISYFVSKIINSPICYTQIKRIKITSPQGSNTDIGRVKNVRGAFKSTCNKRIKGKNILLIDDVWTSGSTINEASKVLKKEGAKHVCVFTIGRAFK